MAQDMTEATMAQEMTEAAMAQDMTEATTAQKATTQTQEEGGWTEVQEMAENLEVCGGTLDFSTGCTKNPSHAQFYQMNEIGVKNLPPTPPPGLSKEDPINWAKAWAAGVVRIGSTSVSVHRPDEQTNGKPYPLSHKRGSCMITNSGCGWLRAIAGPCIGPCLCPDCERSQTKENKHWKVYVLTARHVIFDCIEAKACKVAFFDDLPDGSTTRKMTGFRVVDTDSKRDYCLLMCYTHDKALAQTLVEVCEGRRKTDISMRLKLQEPWHGDDLVDEGTKQRLTELRDKGLEKLNPTIKKLEQISDQTGKINVAIWNRLLDLRASIATSDDGIVGESERMKQAVQHLNGLLDEKDCSTRQQTHEKLEGVDDKTKQTLKELENRLGGTDRSVGRSSESLHYRLEEVENTIRLAFEELDENCSRVTESSGPKLKELWHQRDKAKEEKNQTQREWYYQRDEVVDSLNALLPEHIHSKYLVFVVSHPHGRMKHITVGQFKGKREHALLYTAATCPGSSGGMVLSLGTPGCVSLGVAGGLWYRRSIYPPHSSAVTPELGCSAGWVGWWW